MSTTQSILTISTTNDDLKPLLARVRELKKTKDTEPILQILDHYFKVKNTAPSVSELIALVKQSIEQPEFKHSGFPTAESEDGLYTAGCTEFDEIQYGVFSSLEVAKKGLSKLNPLKPVLFGIISRIKKTGVERLNEFFSQFVDFMSEHGVEGCDFDLGGLDLSRLGRSYASYSALLQLFELASESGIGLKLMGMTEPAAVFGILTGSVAQTGMKFNQLISKLRSSISKFEDGVKDKKGNSMERYIKASVTDLINNKTAYQPHLSNSEYFKLITTKTGNNKWLKWL
jgi:sulfur relay (sulfurtransferase) DsrC/TusE family protein